MKRWFDIIMSFILLIWFMPIMVVTAALILVNLGSPVIFKQQRPGLHGKPFCIYKFRTMADDRDKQGNLMPDEQRLKSLGILIRKLSLDELPQLLNVIKGDLSLVGPRPLLMEYLPLYNARQMRRHEVKPGITGWAQVNGRNAISWEQKFELDVWYVENQSFYLDMKILWFTFLKVIMRDGVNQLGKATTEKFRGSR